MNYSKGPRFFIYHNVNESGMCFMIFYRTWHSGTRQDPRTRVFWLQLSASFANVSFGKLFIEHFLFTQWTAVYTVYSGLNNCRNDRSIRLLNYSPITFQSVLTYVHGIVTCIFWSLAILLVFVVSFAVEQSGARWSYQLQTIFPYSFPNERVTRPTLEPTANGPARFRAGQYSARTLERGKNRICRTKRIASYAFCKCSKSYPKRTERYRTTPCNDFCNDLTPRFLTGPTRNHRSTTGIGRRRGPSGEKRRHVHAISNQHEPLCPFYTLPLHRNRHPRRTRTMDITDRRIIPFTIISICHYYYCIRTHTHEPRVREFVRLSPCDGVLIPAAKTQTAFTAFLRFFTILFFSYI